MGLNAAKCKAQGRNFFKVRYVWALPQDILEIISGVCHLVEKLALIALSKFP